MPAPLEQDVEVDTVADYVGLFNVGGPFQPDGVRWHRGDCRIRAGGSLIPSIARPPSTPADEWSIYQRFTQNAATFVSHETMSEWDWMLYMRHYGARTRLLDWSESPLAALYFAVHPDSKDPDAAAEAGVVWCLRPEKLNEWAGIGSQLLCANIDDDLERYTPTAVKNSPAGTQFKPAALIAPRSFPRLVAQQGVFTVIHSGVEALEETVDEPGVLARIRITAAAKAVIRAHLRSLGITQLSMFPELQSVAEGV